MTRGTRDFRRNTGHGKAAAGRKGTAIANTLREWLRYKLEQYKEYNANLVNAGKADSYSARWAGKQLSYNRHCIGFLKTLIQNCSAGSEETASILEHLELMLYDLGYAIVERGKRP